MVFFTCSHCGESVKKPSVAKHYQTKCRKNEPFLTCVDCLKDFKGNEYEAHTKCVTEDERYSGKGYVPKPSQNKGERKQQAWQECIQKVLKKPTLKPDEQDLLRAISKYENVPRKKSKFVNFLSNAFRQYANKTDLINRVWAEMESVFKEETSNVNGDQNMQEEKPQEVPQTETPKENGVKKDKKKKRQAEDDKSSETAESGEKIKKKKRKHDEENTDAGNPETSIPEDEQKEKKKNKKRKADENDQTIENGTPADETEPEKKKKKKKQEKTTESDISQVPPETPEVETKKKKKNKKSKLEEVETQKITTETPTNESDEITTVKKKRKKSENKENCGEKPEVQEEIEKPISKKKKSKEDTGNETEKQETFDWKATILNILNQDGKNKIQLQKLQKKVLKLHCQILNCENSEKKEKKFMKKLKEIPQIEIDNDFVVLKS